MNRIDYLKTHEYGIYLTDLKLKDTFFVVALDPLIINASFIYKRITRNLLFFIYISENY